MFECTETDVARRFTKTLKLAERNNFLGNNNRRHGSSDGGSSELSEHYLLPSRYGSNIHRPEFNEIEFPNEIEVNETISLHTTLMTVRQISPTQITQLSSENCLCIQSLNIT